MSYCKQTMRPRACEKLSVYDRNGQLLNMDNGSGYLTDGELRSVLLIILLQEWQARFGDSRGASAPSRALFC